MFHFFRQSSAPKLCSVQWKKGCRSYLTMSGLSLTASNTQMMSHVSRRVCIIFLQPIWTIPGRNGGLLWWLFICLLRPHSLFSKLYLSPAMESRGAARELPHSWVFSVGCCWLGYAPMLLGQSEEMSCYSGQQYDPWKLSCLKCLQLCEEGIEGVWL